MGGAQKKAGTIAADLGDQGYLLQQFNNPDDAKVHREGRAVGIWADTDGARDFLLAGGPGTGARSRAAPSTAIQPSIFPRWRSAPAGEPTESPSPSGGSPGPHKIQGIGRASSRAAAGHVAHRRVRRSSERDRSAHGRSDRRQHRASLP